MYELETRIEEIHLTSRRLAEGLLLDAIEKRLTDSEIAKAARFYHAAILRHEDAQQWREKAKPHEFDFDGMDWGTDDDDPFRVDPGPSRGAAQKIKNKRG